MGRLIGIIVAVLAVTISTALAATRNDPDDVGGRLDLKQVTRTYSNGPSTPPIVHLQATTFDGWTLEKCWRRDCVLVFYFDSRQAGGTDRVAYWTVERRGPGRFEPLCDVFSYRRDGRTERLAVGDAAKFRRSAFCSFRKAVLDAERRVRWRVLSVWRAGDGLIEDRAPDSGWYGG